MIPHTASGFGYVITGTPFLDSLNLTLNCRPGDVVVTGTTASDYVKWTSRASAGSSSTNSLYRYGNGNAIRNSTGELNGKSTLISPPGSAVDTQVTAYNSGASSQRTADYVIGSIGVNPSLTFTIALLCKFSNNSDTALQYLCGEPNDITSMARYNGNKARCNQYFGTVDVTLRTANTWQVIWMNLSSAGTVSGIAIDNDAYTTFAPSNPAYGVTTNPFIVGAQGTVFTTCDFEVGGIWTSANVLSAGDRSLIMAELRTFTGEALI